VTEASVGSAHKAKKKCHLPMIDLVVVFVLFIFMIVLLCFLYCYRFLANKDSYRKQKQQNSYVRKKMLGRNGARP